MAEERPKNFDRGRQAFESGCAVFGIWKKRGSGVSEPLERAEADLRPSQSSMSRK